MNSRRTVIHVVLHWLIASAFLLMPFWIKHPFAAEPFSSTYVLGFWLTVILISVIALWLLGGSIGLIRSLQNWKISTWLALMCLIVLWIYCSQTWAFVAETRPEIAQNATLQLLIAAGFILVLICTQPSSKWISLSIILGVLINVVLGGLQVATQGSIGLSILGEFVLDPVKSGVSVIQSGNIRWLRPYGLLPHPNVLAGFIVIGIFALTRWLIHEKRWIRILSNLTLVSFFWTLLLTFSRGAWLGFFIAGLIVIPAVYRHYRFNRKIITSISLLIIAGLCFVAIYSSLLLTRTGIGEESIELRSIADRIVYSQIAQDIIEENTFVGIGAGNFPWYASYYLHNFTDYDLQGDHVHNIYLEIWSELGLVGLLLFVSMTLLGLFVAWRQLASVSVPMTQIGWIGAVIALTVIGFVDHYPLTMIHAQTMWWGILALAVHPLEAKTNVAVLADQSSGQRNNPHP